MANTPYYTKAEADSLNQQIKRQFGTGIIGTVSPNVGGVPQINGGNITENGFYYIGEDGDYGTETGITLTDKIVLLEVKDIETTAIYNTIEYNITAPSLEQIFDKENNVDGSTMKATSDFLASETEATPTEGSTKLVQSGGVADAINRLTNSVHNGTAIGDGALIQSQTSTTFQQWVESSGGGTITNSPDEEDLTVNESNKLLFKDRSAQLDGQLGYKIIRSDFDFSQDLSAYSNSVWGIRYVFDLSDSTILIPEKVTLENDGGLFKNVLLTGSNTYLNNVEQQLFDLTTEFSGTWDLDYVEPTLFGAVGDGIADDSDYIEACLKLTNKIKIRNGKTYRITREINLGDDAHIFGGGEVFVDQTEYLRAIRVGSNSVVSGLVFRGNGVSTTINASLSGGEKGIAISSFGGENIRIKDCRFYDFLAVDHNRGAGIIQISNTKNLIVSECYFDFSNFGFNDIDTSYTTGDAIYDKNVSYSNSDIFIFISSVGSFNDIPNTIISETVNHIISNNIHIKNKWQPLSVGEGIGRHGIAHYSDSKSQLTMSNNIIGNLGRHGLYLRGSNSYPANPRGGSLISGNYFLNCGLIGESGYCSGIRAEDELGTVINGNFFYNTGYNPDGTDGNDIVSDIECVRNVSDLTISNNVFKNSKDYCISLEMRTTSRICDNININNNTIEGIKRGVYIRANSTNLFKNINIHDNHIRITESATGVTTYAGICTELPVDSEFLNTFNITNNTIEGTGKNENQSGICLDVSGFNTSIKVKGNTLISLEYGIRSYRIITNEASNVSHREIGDKTLISDNIFKSCRVGVSFTSTLDTVLKYIDPSNIFQDCDFSYDKRLGLSPSGFSLPVLGRRIGQDESGNVLVELIVDEIPEALTYYKGDRILNNNPLSGGDLGWVCVLSGTPGTWKSIGTIEV